MTSHLKPGFAILAAALLGATFGAGSAAAQSGKDLYASKGCLACHGADAKKTILPLYPKLAGQNAPYLVFALKAYKTQDRKGDQAALMWGMAAQLTDSEIQKIAEFLSKAE
jgi:cytochrome c